jgi:hypothetical protein
MAGIQTEPRPHCPECGAVMVLHRPKPGDTWDPFWGCSKFRQGCRGTRNIAEDGTPEDDEGDFLDGELDALSDWR